MLQLKLDKNLVWILIAVLCCCSTGIARGEDSSGPDPDASSSPNPVSPPVVMPSPAQSSSPALRDAKYYLQSTYSFRNVLEAGFIAGVPNLTAAPVQPQPPAVIDEATATAYEGAMDQYSADVDDWRRSN